MTKCVAFSCSPFGAGDLRTGTAEPTCHITDGILYLSEAQTGNVGVGDLISYTELAGPESFAVLMPARLKFSNGGTTEVKDNCIVIGETSGATAQIRMVERGTGSWAAGAASGSFYLSWQAGTFVAENILLINTLEVVAVIPGNSEGNAKDIWPVKTVTGDVPADAGSSVTNYISHIYADIAAAESGFTDILHINTVDLVSSDLKVYISLYYDHVDYTPDSSLFYIFYGVDGPDNYLTIYTPIGQLESVNTQRHDGTRRVDRWLLARDDIIGLSRNNYTKYYGLYFKVTRVVSGDPYGLRYFASAGDSIFANCIIEGINMEASSSSVGLANITAGTVRVINTVVFGFTSTGAGYGFANLSSGFMYIYNSIVKGCAIGIHNCNAVNSISIDNDDDFSSSVVSYCASNDGDGTNAVVLTPEDYNNEFVDYVNDNYHLSINATKLKNAGIADPADGLYLTDIDGTLWGDAWSIGFDKFITPITDISFKLLTRQISFGDIHSRGIVSQNTHARQVAFGDIQTRGVAFDNFNSRQVDFYIN